MIDTHKTDRCLVEPFRPLLAALSDIYKYRSITNRMSSKSYNHTHFRAIELAAVMAVRHQFSMHYNQ